MKLEEEHKEYVVKCFARFMTLTNIVDAFMEEFEDDLLTSDMLQLPTFDEWMGDPIPDEDDIDKCVFIEDFIKKHQKAYEERYGDEADDRLNHDALDGFNVQCKIDYAQYCNVCRKDALAKHREQIRKNLFNRFRRLDIDHRQFPGKYKALFHNTREEFFANYRIPDLDVPENIARELEVLYGFLKRRIFGQSDSKDVMQHVNLALQILKTIIACNAIDTKPEVVDVTPQDVKALKEARKSVTD